MGDVHAQLKNEEREDGRATCANVMSLLIHIIDKLIERVSA